MGERVHLVCPGCGTVNRVLRAKLGDAPRCGRCARALFDGQPAALDAHALARQIERGEIPLLVDFWAPWCGPCRAMAPAYAAAAARLEPQVRVAKLDTEAFPAAAERHAIRSLPTLILFRGGREVARHSGAIGDSEIVRWVGAQL